MNKSKAKTITAFIFASIGLLFGPAFADESASVIEPMEVKRLLAPPKGVAPLIGMAVSAPKDADNSSEYAPFLKLQIPKVVWEVTGKERPKLEWKKIKAEVEMVTLEVHLGDPEASQIAEQAQNRLVDLNGKRLSREDVLNSLGEITPVLVSVSGEMPDSFYLQCSKPDTLILILGLPSLREFNLLPTSRASRRETE